MSDASTGSTRGASPRGAVGPLALIKHLREEGFTALDAATGEPLGTVGTGRQPHAVVVHPSGRWAYVPYMGSGTIEVVDLQELSVTTTVEAITAPVGAALAGDRLLVGTYGPLPGVTAPGLAVFETDATTGDLRLVDELELGRCAGIVVDGTGGVWAALKEDDTVVRLSADGDDLSVRERIHVPAGPQGMRYAPEYDIVGVDCVEGDAVAFLEADGGGLLGVVDAPNPRSGAVVPDHDRWFVSDTEGDGLTVVDLATMGDDTITDRVFLGTPTAFTDARPDGSLVVADAEDDDRVTFLDPAGPTVVSRVQTGERPHHARFTADGETCYVPNAGADTVSVLDVTDRADAVERTAEISVFEGAAPSGCYLTDRRRKR
ncbi:MAG: beta-propeller fold lactonase family protein [Halorientalis sp.]